jgi:DNA-binding PadR family transcriptional regulator
MMPKNLELSSLELLLLAMVKLGVSTTYDLMTKAGLSVGITSRSLRRLEEAELLSSTAGSRGSQRFTITKIGERELRRFWNSIVHQESPASFEFALRVLYLGWLSGDVPAATKYATHAAAELRRRAQQQATEAEMVRERYPQVWMGEHPGMPELSAAGLVSVHKFLKNSCDAAVSRAQADSLEKATAELNRLIPASRFVGASIQQELFGRGQEISSPAPKRSKHS